MSAGPVGQPFPAPEGAWPQGRPGLVRAYLWPSHDPEARLDQDPPPEPFPPPPGEGEAAPRD